MRGNVTCSKYQDMSLPRAYLTKKLTQPLPIKGGAVLLTIQCAADYMLTLPHAESCNSWRHAAQLLLNQADVATVSRQVYLALFLEARFDLAAMDRGPT